MIPLEESEQAAFFRWVEFMLQTNQIPELDTIYAIPNGGHRIKVVAAKLKAQGVRRGVLDICWPFPAGGYHGLYVEMKRRVGGRLKPDQKKFIEALKRDGYRAEVAQGNLEAQDIVTAYYRLAKGESHDGAGRKTQSVPGSTGCMHPSHIAPALRAKLERADHGADHHRAPDR